MDKCFYESLLNNFIVYFNSYNNTQQHMFKDINYNDKSSTNYMMEKFYSLMYQYKENKNDNKIYELDICSPDDDNELSKLKDSDTLYILKYNNLKYYSKNELALLIKVTELNLSEWKIESLR
jgi:hypothetical protein